MSPITVLLVLILVQCCDIWPKPVKRRFKTRKHKVKMRAESSDEYNHYNPNLGYEPYWPGGDWVFHDPYRDPRATTTQMPLVCGDECSELYKKIGPVCGLKSGQLEISMEWGFDRLNSYQTYDTYCKFLDAQCRTGFLKKLTFIHVGNCGKQTDVFKIIDTESPIMSRLSTYLSTIYHRFRSIEPKQPLFEQHNSTEDKSSEHRGDRQR